MYPPSYKGKTRKTSSIIEGTELWPQFEYQLVKTDYRKLTGRALKTKTGNFIRV